ncbi:uncharacterized protein BO87DRAFT_182338 [Aspergillus neoniger CBS 115656]|uniref:Uncharacterized protein n=1 Tax=Aspergillus neoniger (strain CBS 115656) TaxID=1448310 RepID=A0A318YW52_ASPNB|nr:hypothetical protein BO87DRAFT_182338 [Aspergillus neoniger CBS 115656]PYH29432.1 hypothetical protein BO87DRAFT_182338 [Aspergillus neoniger CBS 115656]
MNRQQWMSENKKERGCGIEEGLYMLFSKSNKCYAVRLFALLFAPPQPILSIHPWNKNLPGDGWG